MGIEPTQDSVNASHTGLKPGEPTSDSSISWCRRRLPESSVASSRGRAQHPPSSFTPATMTQPISQTGFPRRPPVGPPYLCAPLDKPSALGCNIIFQWGCSSAGRARRWQCRGQGFDPPHLHLSLEAQKATFGENRGGFFVLRELWDGWNLPTPGKIAGGLNLPLIWDSFWPPGEFPILFHSQQVHLFYHLFSICSPINRGKYLWPKMRAHRQPPRQHQVQRYNETCGFIAITTEIRLPGWFLPALNFDLQVPAGWRAGMSGQLRHLGV